MKEDLLKENLYKKEFRQYPELIPR